MSSSTRGLLFIVSAPSGAGKTTLVERLVEQTSVEQTSRTLVEQVPKLKMSRSYTSRSPRDGEIDGEDYNFVTRACFESMVAADEFLEWADVFGNLYGTSAADTERELAAGDDLVLVIDVQGARTLRARGLEAISIFVMPPSFEVLEHRPRGRSKDSEDSIQRRLQVARHEVSSFHEYQYVVINDEIFDAVDRLRSIVMSTRALLKRMTPQAEQIVRTFS
jgi:guanylate kinase